MSAPATTVDAGPGESYSLTDCIVASSFGVSVLLGERDPAIALRRRLTAPERREARRSLLTLQRLQRKRTALTASLRASRAVRYARRLRARLEAVDEAAIVAVAALPLRTAWVRNVVAQAKALVTALEVAEAELATTAENVGLPVRFLRLFFSGPVDHARMADVLHLSSARCARLASEVGVCLRRVARCEAALRADASEIHLLAQCIRAAEATRSRDVSAGVSIDYGAGASLRAFRADAEAARRVLELLAAEGVELVVPHRSHEDADEPIDSGEERPVHPKISARPEGPICDRCGLVHAPGVGAHPAAPSSEAAKLVLRPRNAAAPTVSIALAAIERNLAGKAETLAFSTRLPDGDSRAPSWRPRTVPLRLASTERRDGVPRQASTLADESGASYADLGQLGESLVFEMMLKRWQAIAGGDRAHAHRLLRRIADEYWACDHSTRDTLESALSDGDAVFSAPLVRALLWPSQTPFGDMFGFDLFGVDDDLSEWLCVEVKTTQGPPTATFQWTANELARARHEGRRYALARVSRVHSDAVAVHIWRDPCALVAAGALIATPESFVVSVGSTATAAHRDSAPTVPAEPTPPSAAPRQLVPGPPA